MLDRKGPVPYRIAFPSNTRSHNIFHVSIIKTYFHDPNHVIGWNVI